MNRVAARVVAKLVAVVVSVSTVAALGAGWWSLSSVVDGVGRLPADVAGPLTDRPPVAAGAPRVTTVLLIGSDRRVGADVGGGVVGERADSILLLRVDPAHKRADVLSIPRDSWVDLPGRGAAKANAALAFGGEPMVDSLAERLTGWPVDHVVVADFAGVREITTALGGVTVHNPERTVDPLTRKVFPAGPVTLSGVDAMIWTRQRLGLPGGDLDRIDRQQRLVAAVAARVLTPDPFTLRRSLVAIAAHLTVDPGLTTEAMVDLAADLAAVPEAGRRFSTAPVAGTGRSPDGQAYLRLDTAALAEACAAVAAGRAPGPPG